MAVMPPLSMRYLQEHGRTPVEKGGVVK